MGIFEKCKEDEPLGKVIAVDTATVTVLVDNVDKLRRMQVNRLVMLPSRPGQQLIGMVQKIVRSRKETAAALADDAEGTEVAADENVVRILLIGTHKDKDGLKKNVFLRTLETVPEIDAWCFPIEDETLTAFMQSISGAFGTSEQKLALGTYTLDEKAPAYLDGNKFFQRHAVIVGSTGAGKSWTTAHVLEQVAELPNANALVFDLHGEYGSLEGDGFRHFRISGPGDIGKSRGLDQGVVYLPFWLLGYEAINSMLVERSDQNAPNQTMLMSRTIREAKENFLRSGQHDDILKNFTIDSPVPFVLDAVVSKLQTHNEEMVQGSSNRLRQGDYFGKLSRVIDRLENKRTDRRLGFLFQGSDETQQFEWLQKLCKTLIGGSLDHEDNKGGVKIIDFSEVPSDVLPIIVSLVAGIAFSVQQWAEKEKRHPIAIFCDEAHLYIPHHVEDNKANETSIAIFERIAKEGRKYGVGLVVISQRPSEVNRTVLSQCNNFVAMRLTNADDQNVIRRLLPDSLGGFSDLLPVLDTGEVVVVGDASLLPSRIRVEEPQQKPRSGTVDFWGKWSEQKPSATISEAVDAWRKQTRN